MTDPKKKTTKQVVSQKVDTSYWEEMEAQGNILTVDPALKRELEEQGLAYRFVNAKKLKESHGYHRRNWVPYRRQSTKPADGPIDFAYGVDPAGYIIRGDLILAVKPVEFARRQREQIDKRTQALTRHNKASAQEIQERAREAGLRDVVIQDGYEA